ncbi:MAG: dihydroorotate dehydrogenase [Phascolarctobacterium sp.]|nr:dihydroorotate dehydrogenase [Phascolarctobacterium sp.]
MVKALYEGRLAVDIAGLKMQTPVTTGSGTFGFGLEFTDFLDLEKVGAVTVKGTSLLPAAGNKGQRAVETPSGMLNCIGLENPGSEYFLEKTLPELRKYDVPVIVNIYGHSPEEYGEVAKKLDVDGVDAVEINISCPNVKEGGIVFGTCPEAAAEVVRAVKASTSKMVITKLSPNVTDIVTMAKAVEEAGTDAISMINTLLGTVIDIERQKPVLGNITGGLSGPAVRPVAVRLVYQVAQAVNVPIIGMGGIMNARDAIEFMLAGASAISVGTANFIQPDIAETIAHGMLEYLDRHNVQSINDIVGLALPNGKASMPYLNK